MSTEKGYKGCKNSSASTKRRAATACLSCRARKVRCDVFRKGIPCTNCHLDCKGCVVNVVKARRALRSVNATETHPLWDGLSGLRMSTRKTANITPFEAEREPNLKSSELCRSSKESSTSERLAARSPDGGQGHFDSLVPEQPEVRRSLAEEAYLSNSLAKDSPGTSSNNSFIPEFSPSSTSTPTTSEDSYGSDSSPKSHGRERVATISRCSLKQSCLDLDLKSSYFNRTPLYQLYGGLHNSQALYIENSPLEEGRDSNVGSMQVDEELYSVLTAECPWFGA